VKLGEVIRRLDRRCMIEVEEDGRVMLYVNGEYECSKRIVCYKLRYKEWFTIEG